MTASVPNLIQHVKFLTNIGERRAGTKQMKEAALYVADFLKSYGYEVDIMRFPMLTSEIIGEPLLLINGQPIKCKGVYFSGNAKDLEGEVVYDQDLSREDLEGKIVLTDVSYSPPRPEKARLAKEKSALAIIYISFGSKDSEIISTGGIKYVWGNPTSKTIKEIPRIPAVTISRKDGERIKEMIAKGKKVIARLTIETQDRWVLSNQPVGFKGSRKKDVVVFGSPLEALGSTAIDNSAANSAMLEIARTIRPKKYDVMFVFTDGHEIAEAAGSTYVADTMWSYLKRYGVIYINVESLGARGASRAVSYVSPSIRDFVEEVEEKYGIRAEHHNEIRIADSSFTGLGLPYYWFTHIMSKRYVKAYNGATHGWWYRSEADTIEHVDFELLKSETDYLINFYGELERSELVGYKLSNYLKDAVKVVSSLSAEDEFVKEKLRYLHKKLRLSLISLLKVEKDKELILKHKNIFREIRSEISSAFMTISGKYEQDPYGSIWKDAVLPGLIASIEEYKRDKNLGATRLIREVNRISDALELLEAFVDLID